MKKIKKYFLVFYTGSDINGQRVGNCMVECNSAFPNRNESEKFIKESNFSMINVVITNVIELTHNEYTAWCSL